MRSNRLWNGRRRSGIRNAVFGLLISSCLGFAGVASANDQTTAVDEVGDVTTTSLAHDAEDYAKEFGVSTFEAERRLTLQRPLHEAIGSLEALAPARFAGGWIEHVPDFKAVAYFTGDKAGLHEVLAYKSSLPIEVRVGAAFSIADLTFAMERVQSTLDRDYPSLASEIDFKAGALNVYGPTGIASVELAQIQSKTEVPIRYEEAPSFVPTHTYGGKKLDGPGCTGGFTVRNTVTGDRGLLTAGHCGNTVEYWQDAATHYPLTFFMGESRNAFSDIQWSKENIHTVYDDYFDGVGLVDVSGQVGRANALGDFVCHWGIGSALGANPVGRSCGTITNISFDPGDLCGATGAGPCNPSWVRVDGANLACFFGDSGGPVFASGDAYGTQSFASFTGTEKGQCIGMAFQSRDFEATLNLAILQ